MLQINLNDVRKAHFIDNNDFEGELANENFYIEIPELSTSQKSKLFSATIGENGNIDFNAFLKKYFIDYAKVDGYNVLDENNLPIEDEATKKDIIYEWGNDEIVKAVNELIQKIVLGQEEKKSEQEQPLVNTQIG